jgi:colicin import membrane protein
VDLELQLKVWKELAISKQVLMRAAADALKLDPNCSQDELKQAIDIFIKKIEQADVDVAQAKQQAQQAIAELERKLQASERAHSLAETSAAELKVKLDKVSQEVSSERAEATREQQKLKAQLAEKEKALKAINAALADTPENVLRKMNTLKKQKQDEADARRQVETALAALRTEKQQQQQKMTKLREDSTKLVTTYRDLHVLSSTLHQQLTAADPTANISLPALDETLLESIQNPDQQQKEPAGKTRPNGRSAGLEVGDRRSAA